MFRKTIIFSLLVVIHTTMVFAGFINLDFSSLSGLSQMNKDLNKMVEMQKVLDKLPIILSENNSSAIQEDNNRSNTSKTILNAEFTASFMSLPI